VLNKAEMKEHQTQSNRKQLGVQANDVQILLNGTCPNTTCPQAIL
jgi:hypothetical protein